MSEPLIGQIFHMQGTATMTLPEDTSLEEVIRTLAENPNLRAVFLVNNTRKFTLMITRRDLLKWAHLNITGGKGSEMGIAEIFRILDARKARDLASPASSYISVKENDSLQKALYLMMEYEEDTLPVLDSDGKVLGDLRLPEILFWVFTYSRYNRDNKD